MREITRLERFLGPENYRILTGLLKTPASIIGFVLIGFFILIAIAAPVIAQNPNDPYKIPRDGFSADPKPMGTEWRRNVPPLPVWWKPIMGTDEWTDVLGTSQGQYDIFYGIIWGTRTAFYTGMLVTFTTLLIGVVVGAVSAYYGGVVDNIIMRIVDVLLICWVFLAALILAALTPKIGKSLIPTMTALIAFGWMGYSRIIRGDILRSRNVITSWRRA